jgi:hypothetical protein
MKNCEAMKNCEVMEIYGVMKIARLMNMIVRLKKNCETDKQDCETEGELRD